jgi:hypothetical protein
MKNFRITEEEVRNILSMHKVLMNEQISKLVDVNNPEYKVLTDAVKKNCLSGGQPVAKDDNGKYYYRKPSVKQPGKDIDFFADMTYKFVDGSKSGTWKCEGLIELNTVQNSPTQSVPEPPLNANQLKIMEFLKPLRWFNTPVPTEVEVDKKMFLKMDLTGEDVETNKDLSPADKLLVDRYKQWFTKKDYPNGFFVYKRNTGTQAPTEIGKGARVEITIESCKTAIESLHNNLISPRTYPLEPEEKTIFRDTTRLCIEPANKGKFFAKFGLKRKVKELKQRRRI